MQTRRERISWSNYHSISSMLFWVCPSLEDFKIFLPVYWWCIIEEHYFFFLLSTSSEAAAAGKEALTISHQVANALWYAAGYIPRAFVKKLKSSDDPQKARLWLCLLGVLDDGDEEHTDSEDWIKLINRNSLTHITEVTFQAILAMEVELRNIGVGRYWRLGGLKI